MRRLKKWMRRETGQAMVFFAVVMPGLMFALGLTVEGGYLIVQYRHLQVAADMAALVGAQSLPCTTTDTSCMTTAEQKGCTYASRNDGNAITCQPGTTGASYAAVPPVTCSPYDTIDYGNDGTGGCKTNSNTLTIYDYIEVRLSQTFSVPIFGNVITLSAHAVARKGQPGPRRFAIIVLDPTQSKALNMSGSQGGGLMVVGPIVSDSVASDSIYTGGQSTQEACDGQWYTSANEVVPPNGPAANVISNTGGTTSFAPAICTGGTTDSPTRFIPNFPPVSDPYSSSVAPSSTNMSNCTPCESTGWTYQWTTSRTAGSWVSASSLGTISGAGTSMEMFPGIYPNLVKITNGTVYVNPGVYTFQNGFAMSGGTICIYGAPACDAKVNLVNSGANCSTASMRSTDTAYYVPSGNWYYYCSPWGMWDSTALPGRPVTTTAPTFTDGSTPLNGVTFYVSSGQFTMNGNGAAYLAFPNPCPGTGSFTTGVTPSVDFRAGSTSAYYTYPGGSLAATDGYTTSPAGQMYPSGDLSFTGECAQDQGSNARLVWTGEMSGQHLHFLIWTRNSGTGVSLNGTGLQNWWGIIYSPGSAGCGTACTVGINGSGGSGVGPPLLVGEVVADNANFGGSANFEVYYSPCQSDGNPCSQGFGTSLVQ